MKKALKIFAIAEGINVLAGIFMYYLDYKHSPDSNELTFLEWYPMMAVANGMELFFPKMKYAWNEEES